MPARQVGSLVRRDARQSFADAAAQTMTHDGIRNVLQDRPALVTGAEGFIGSHLVDSLLQFGSRVHVFIRATSSGSLQNLAEVRSRLRIHRGDLTDKQAVMNALRAVQDDGEKPVLFHLGAQAHVGESWGRPYETVAANVLGTLNLLQLAQDELWDD